MPMFQDLHQLENIHPLFQDLHHFLDHCHFIRHILNCQATNNSKEYIYVNLNHHLSNYLSSKSTNNLIIHL